MNLKMKIIIGIAIFLVIVFISYKTYKWLNEPFMSGIEHTTTISFPEISEKVYIRAKAWGVSGNHSEILLSTSPINNAHGVYLKDEQFTFVNSSELYYQKKGIDSLLLYVDYKSEVPKNLSTQINIQQIELKNAKEIAEYARNYKKYGLSRISVYPDK
jgi:hypothetical protein